MIIISLTEKKQMKENNFIDSNILIYAHTLQDENKMKIAQGILSSKQIIIANTQGINESINVFIKRFKIFLNNIQNIIEQTFLFVTIKTINSETIQLGLKICKNYYFSYYDSLIIASALQNECSILYSEDLQHH